MSTQRDYTSVLKPLLPPAAFVRRPSRLLYAVGHLVVIGATCLILRRYSFWPIYPLAAVIIGHSLACLAFFAHELSHNSIIRRGAFRSILETILWGLNLIPSTLWDEVHNHTHHLHTNTVRDPDRRYTEAEKDARTLTYTVALYPHSQTIPWNPLVFIQFLGYISRNIIAALSGGHWGMLPACPNYSRQQRIKIVGELFVIGLLQAATYIAVGCSLIKYLFAGPLALAITSAVVMGYVFTNHFLNPLADENDPVASSTSVIVPSWVDWLHSYFSYHVEHHLFPSLDSRYCPELSRLLQAHFPNEYKRISFMEAWHRLWKQHPWAVVEVDKTEIS